MMSSSSSRPLKEAEDSDPPPRPPAEAAQAENVDAERASSPSVETLPPCPVESFAFPLQLFAHYPIQKPPHKKEDSGDCMILTIENEIILQHQAIFDTLPNSSRDATTNIPCIVINGAFLTMQQDRVILPPNNESSSSRGRHLICSRCMKQMFDVLREKHEREGGGGGGGGGGQRGGEGSLSKGKEREGEERGEGEEGGRKRRRVRERERSLSQGKGKGKGKEGEEGD